MHVNHAWVAYDVGIVGICKVSGPHRGAESPPLTTRPAQDGRMGDYSTHKGKWNVGEGRGEEGKGKNMIKMACMKFSKN